MNELRNRGEVKWSNDALINILSSYNGLSALKVSLISILYRKDLIV